MKGTRPVRFTRVLPWSRLGRGPPVAGDRHDLLRRGPYRLAERRQEFVDEGLVRPGQVGRRPSKTRRPSFSTAIVFATLRASAMSCVTMIDVFPMRSRSSTISP